MDDRSNIAATATGSSEGGFIVDLHDGARHLTHISHADGPEAAADEGREAFGSDQGEPDCNMTHGEPDWKSEAAALRDMIANLTARTESLEKHREGVKTAKDQERDDESDRLRKEAEAHKAENERLLAETAAERERNKPDAHGRKPGEDGPQTAATGKASEPDASIVSLEPAHSEAEDNARDAGTLGVENRENAAASAKNATYAAAPGDLPSHGAAPKADLAEHDRYEELATKPDLTEDEMVELDRLRSAKAWRE